MSFVKMPSPNWADPVDLPGLPPVPAWSDDLFPDSLREWLHDVSERTQCPPEYAAVGALVALASVIGRGCAIRPKQHDDWTVVPNLWGAVVGPPSAMKTPALREAMRPLRWLASRESEGHRLREFDREQIEARKKALQDALRKAAKEQIVDINKWKDGRDKEAELRQEFDEIQSAEEEANAERRFVVHDATVEKLGELLAQSPRGLLLFRDELVGWLSSLDRLGHENDRSFYLESWAGDDSYIYDRISRGTIEIECACMSILGGIQPGPLSTYLRAAAAGGTGADGLIQRFQLLVYPDAPKKWKNVDRWPDTIARDKVREIFVRLADATPSQLGAQTGDDLKIPFVRFDSESQAFFSDWYGKLWTRVRADEEHEAIESHIIKYSSLLPSLALIFQLCDVGRGPVEIKATKRAAAWCDFLEAHMRRVYASVAAKEINGARTLLKKLRAGKLPNPFTARDAYRPGWAGLSSPKEVDEAIAKLEEYGWLRQETVQTGGRPRVDIYIHPEAMRA